MEIRDLETLGPLVASSLRSDATAQGPRVSKSRISMDSPYNLYIHIHIHIHVHVLYILGDCLTSRPKGHLRPRELWFLIYSCTICVKKVHVYTRKNVSSFTESGTYF